MTTALRIKDWAKLFQKADLRDGRVSVWRYVPIPINLNGEHFRMLMASAQGRETFAVFIALCELAANLPVRGTLADERGPLAERTIAIKTGIPERVVRLAIGKLSDPEIGWLCAADGRTENGEPPGNVPNGERPTAALPQPQPSAATAEEPQPQPNDAERAAAAAGSARQEQALAALTADPWPSVSPRKAKALVGSRGPEAVMAAIRRGRKRRDAGESIGPGLIVTWIENGDAGQWAETDAERRRKDARVKWGRTDPSTQAALLRAYRNDHPGDGNPDEVLVESNRFADWLQAKAIRMAGAA